jgi:hypothetical protein
VDPVDTAAHTDVSRARLKQEAHRVKRLAKHAQGRKATLAVHRLRVECVRGA